MANKLICLACNVPHKVSERRFNPGVGKHGRLVAPKVLPLYNKDQQMIGIMCYKKYVKKVRQMKNGGTTTPKQ